MPWRGPSLPPGASPQTYVGDDGSTAGVRLLSGAARTGVVLDIIREMQACGGPVALGVPTVSLACALVSTAWHESRMDPGAWRREPDGRVSFGVVQCLVGSELGYGSRPGGAGHGWDPVDLVTVRGSILCILTDAVRRARTRPPPHDIAGLTRWWTVEVERPVDSSTKANERVAWLARLGVVS